MPTIRPSVDLRNKYNEISQCCHSHNESMFITKKGKGNLAVLSIDTYELLCGKFEPYKLLDEGICAEHKRVSLAPWMMQFVISERN